MVSYVSSLALVVAALVLAVSAQDKYSSEFDSVDLSGLLQDPTKLQSYIDCFKKETNEDCDELGSRVKAVLPELLVKDCERCTDKQKGALPKVVGFLARQRPDDWTALQGKYDLDNTYAQKHPELFA